MAGLHISVLVEQEAGEGEGDGGEFEPGGERSQQDEGEAGPEVGGVASARHLVFGEAGVGGRVRERGLAPDHEQVEEAGRAEHPSERGYGRLGEEDGEGEERGRACEQGLDEEVRREQRVLPEVAGLGLREEVGRVDGRHRGEREAGEDERERPRRFAEQGEEEVERDD